MKIIAGIMFLITSLTAAGPAAGTQQPLDLISLPREGHTTLEHHIPIRPQVSNFRAAAGLTG